MYNKKQKIIQNELGYQVTPAGPRSLDENIIRSIVRLRLGGLSYDKICAELRVSKTTVSKVLKESF